MVDPNAEVIESQNESICEDELVKREEEHEEVMERFWDDLQQTIW